MKNKENEIGILITGAGGYIGKNLLARLVHPEHNFRQIIALDIKETSHENRLQQVEYIITDIRSPELERILKNYQINIVVHLASIVNPGKKSDRAFEYSVDVLGTKNVLECCVRSGVQKIIVTSSGAAYGYHPDNPMPLSENDPIRGNTEFAYSHHKRLVEEMLADYRTKYPALQQLIFRPGTILGEKTENQITNLFQKRFIIGIQGSTIPFVLIWDEDVISCIIKGILEDVTGIYNLAGDGIITMKEIAEILGKPYISLPVILIHFAIWLMRKMGLTRYGTEQINFLRYRPVLSNKKLKEEFGYIPQLTTKEVFRYYLSHRNMGAKNGRK